MAHEFKWGIVGTAGIAEEVIAAIRSTGNGVVHAVASRTLTRAGEWGKRFDIPRVFGSYLKLIQSGEVDAVYIPLPNSMHDEWCLRAIESGVPVLCEKPFTLNAAQAAIVAEASTRAGVPVAEAFMYRFAPLYNRVREVIAEGRIGRVTTVFSRFTFFLDDRSSISASAGLGGGALMDVGCYCVNLSRMIAGAEPVRATAFAHLGEVDETMTGVLEFPGGLLAHFETSIENFERHGAEIAGTGGAIIIERPWKPWIPDENRAQFTVRRPEGDEVVTTPGGNGYVLEVEDFMAAVRDKRPPRWGVADAVKNMAAIDALFKSVKEGRAVAVGQPGGQR